LFRDGHSRLRPDDAFREYFLDPRVTTASAAASQGGFRVELRMTTLTFHTRPALTPLFAALVLYLTAPAIASAQDVMQLDLAFKNGQLSGQASDGKREGSIPQPRRHDTRDALRRVQVKKRRFERAN
jgi:hypothetical protein